MNLSDSDVLMDFLRLPLENPEAVFDKFLTIPGAILFKDNGERPLERFLFIKGNRDNRVLLVAHADTVWDDRYTDELELSQELANFNGIIKNNNGGLGADDRAGCAIIWLLKEMGHSILITDGEESGRAGSSWLMENHPEIADEINNTHQFAVQFDKRGSMDFKCYSVGTNEFRQYISGKTGYTEPNFYSFTDIVGLCRDICGVNLSIGYYGEHTDNEYIIVKEWENTLNICRKWLSEDELPCFTRS